MKLQFDNVINDMYHRILKSKHEIAIFAFDNGVHGVLTYSKRYVEYMTRKDSVLIGIYNKHIEKIDLSADISMIVDEWPDDDE